ncbi:CinA family protein [Thiothrix subterranea]|uniref:Nicotinamide-nucleotide amidohydrolase family protein n=1 Tax=Thiothrix subterranea TaxID=2735563 RepID=A0AA51MLL8_9GAMM|nr:nicotinamide-nucleotide amidohydrolase family protein [Thiothrix subterranea]MDQ5768924.1 nicotinamide-nucleotide amidohydrolase family protein [Thiothrix subterranea]WML86160.1 nicotinamide-nucleotide amidohydrolase family protein [Thiothrix subterranea]
MEVLLAQVAAALQAKGWLLTTAESCTGGWIAKLCTDLVGSSVWFERGFVTYSNEAKQEMLGVPVPTLAEHGAVSEAVTAAMATGALLHSRAQVAVSVSGIAGPGGGTTTKPVGMVCFGWAAQDGTVRTATQYFDGDREAVRYQAVQYALHGVLQILAD